MRGSVGTSCGTIIHRRQKPIASNCKQCIHYRKIDDLEYCMGSGDVIMVRKESCLYYSGPYIKSRKQKSGNRYKHQRNKSVGNAAKQ